MKLADSDEGLCRTIFTTWINFLKNLYGSFDQWSLTDKRDIHYRGVEIGSHYFFVIFADHAGKSE